MHRFDLVLICKCKVCHACFQIPSPDLSGILVRVCILEMPSCLLIVPVPTCAYYQMTDFIAAITFNSFFSSLSILHENVIVRKPENNAFAINYSLEHFKELSGGSFSS